MNRLAKKPILFSTFLICGLLLTVGLNCPLVYATADNEKSDLWLVHGQQGFIEIEEDAFNFMEKVLMIDLSRYEVVSRNVLPPPEQLGSQLETINLRYGFRAIGSSIDESISIRMRFTKGTLTNCLVDFNEPPLLSKEMPEDILESLDKAQLILEKYSAWSGAEHIKPMLGSLDEVETLKNHTKYIENMKFMINCETDVDTNEIELVRIRWTHWENDIEFRRKSLGMIFLNEKALRFHDWWNIYSVGSAELKISERDAAQIAKEAIKTYTYEAADYEGEIVDVKNFTVLDEPLYVELGTDYRGDHYYMLYPFWEVYLGLDTMYLGGVTSFRVFVWGDTGEVIGIYPTGGHAIPPAQESQDTQPSPLYENPLIIAILAALTAATAIALFTLKRRQKMVSLKN